MNDKGVETVKSGTVEERRKLFRRLAALAGLGITATLLSLDKTGLLPQVEACNTGTLCYSDGTTNGVTIEGDAGGSGLTIGVLGTSLGGIGVRGTTTDGGVSVLGLAGSVDSVPVSAWGLSGQTANLQEWGQGSLFGVPVSAVNAAGWLGVGTGTPARAIHLQSDNAVFRMDRDVDSSAFMLVRTAPSGNFSTIWKTFYVGVNASGVNSGEFFIGDVATNVSGASTIRLMIDNSGNVGIGSIANTQTSFSNILTLPNNSDTTGRGLANAWSTYSSIRWKMNIQPIQGALDIIQHLRGVRFNWRTGGKEDIGLIAEEVGQVVPEIVTYEPNGHDAQSLDYSRLIPVTIQAIKELKTENNMLRETLQAENKALRERVEVLERKLAAS